MLTHHDSDAASISDCHVIILMEATIGFKVTVPARALYGVQLERVKLCSAHRSAVQ